MGFRQLLLATVAFACLGLPGMAEAQSTSAATNGTTGAPGGAPAKPSSGSGAQLQEVVVTARRQSENLQTTPISVTAVSAQSLDKLNITSIDKISQLVPNLSIVQGSGGIGGNTAFIRGIGGEEPLLTVDSGVGQYLDGVYLGRIAANNLDLVDVQRVEVLRGPQGTLFGRNTTGGAVNVVTRQPSDTFGVEEKVQYGSYNDWFSRTRIDTGEIGSTGLTASLAYLHHGRDGYVNNPNVNSSRDPGALDTNALFAKVHGAWGKLTMDLTGDFDHDRGQREPFQIVAPYPGAQAYFSQSPSYGGQPFVTSTKMQSDLPLQYVGIIRNETSGAAATLQYEVDPALTLKSISSYRRWWAAQPTNYASNLQGPVVDFASPTLYSVQAVSPFIAGQKVSQYQVSQEFQALGKTERWNYVGGIYLFEEHVAEFNSNYFTLGLPPSYLSSLGFPAAVGQALASEGLSMVGVNLGQLMQYSGDSSSAAAYGQATYRPPVLNDKLSITGGLRYTVDRKTLYQPDIPDAGLVTGSFSSLNDLSLPAQPSRDGRVEFHNLSYAASIDYKWTPQTLTYARYSTGYKSGGFDARAGVNTVLGTSYPFTYGPEKATAYEIGIKNELFDRRLRANADVFYTKYDGLQLPVYTGGNGFTPNANAHYEGAELEIQAIPIDHLTLDGSLGYTDAIYDQFTLLNPATGIVSNYAKSSQFPYVPRYTVHVGAQYDFPAFSFGELSVRSDYSLTSKRYFFTNTLLDPMNNAIKDPGQNLLSARLILSHVNIHGADVQFEFFGENLLNQTLIDSAIDFGPSIGVAGVSYGEPRHFGISAKMDF
jgi:iron complex outermembrane recepter protein